jgi:uncharacterized short protein YbdD (DUF466 family)
MKNPNISFLKVDTLDFSKYNPLYFIGGLGLCLYILIFLAGCSPVSIAQPSPTVQSTTAAESVETPETLPLLVPNIEFSPITDPEQLGALKTSRYSDPQDLFSLPVPENWLIIQNHNSATLTDTQAKPAIRIDIVNTGYELNADSFTNFFENREMDRTSEFENYIEITHQQKASPNSILLTKQCFQQDCNKTLVTLYKQQEQAIFMFDSLVDQDFYGRYQDFFKTLTDTIKINPDKVSNLSVYSFDQARTYSNDHFSILTPSFWSHKQSRGENILVDTITSPDEQSIIQTIVYDDGKTMSRNIAGNLVLTLLSENYTKGIIIETDGLLEDGREKITWRSNTTEYRGITLFETRESAMLVVTVIWSNDPEQHYQDILEKIIDSYTIIRDEG